MKKLIIIPFLIIGLCSCGDRVKSWEIDKAKELCQDHKGIDNISTFLYSYVFCMDGKMFEIKYEERK